MQQQHPVNKDTRRQMGRIALAAAGRSGRSATGGAATGLMNAGQAGTPGAAPQLGHADKGGADAGSGNMAAINNQAMLAKANGGGSGGGDDSFSCSAGPRQLEGSRGLANGSFQNASLTNLRQNQSSDEFRNSTASTRSEFGQSSMASGQDVQDARILKENPHLGTGGGLPVNGGVRGDGTRAVATSAGENGNGNGNNGQGAQNAERSVETPVHRGPGTAVTSGNPTPARPGLTYGQG